MHGSKLVSLLMLAGGLASGCGDGGSTETDGGTGGGPSGNVLLSPVGGGGGGGESAEGAAGADCAPGVLGCPCYGNDTCDEGLTCQSDRCEPDRTGGEGGASAGSGGDAATGGVQSAGGSVPVPTGGSAGTGGAAGTGGGAGTAVTTIDGATVLSALTADQVTQLCDDSYAHYYESGAIPVATACKWKGLSFATSSSAPTQEQLRSNCSGKEDGCLADPATVFADNPARKQIKGVPL